MKTAKNINSNKTIIKKVEQRIYSKGPKSLYSRFLLITILPVIIIQVLSTYIFYERHWDSLFRNMVSTLSGDIATVVNGVYNLKPEDRDAFLVSVNDYMNLRVSIIKDKKIDLTDNKNEKYPILISTIKTKIDSNVAIFETKNDDLKLEIQMKDDVITIYFTSKRIANPSTYIFIFWMIGSSVLLMIISVLFLKGQVRSILNLSTAAEKFGKGQDIKNFKPQGASEIRLAGIAFIEMKERIRRLIDTRTQMLAGVSHDLKTPLTRMKLMISMMKDKDSKTQLEDEISEMSKMIESYLNFAKLEGNVQISEAIRSVSLNTLLNDIKAKYKNYDNQITIDVSDDIFLHIRPDYFSRALVNLIDNAIKYSTKLNISATVDETNAYINFEDNGPGIPENKLKAVFQPFYRIDESRNSETGGVGLGLTIARDIILKHGGEVKLGKSEALGGLKATIILPK